MLPEYYGRVTEDTMQKGWYYKTTIRKIYGEPREGLIHALSTETVWQYDQKADLRQAVLFYSDDRTLIGAVYFDEGGSRGSVNGTSVLFDGKVFSFVKKQFPLSLE